MALFLQADTDRGLGGTTLASEGLFHARGNVVGTLFEEVPGITVRMGFPPVLPTEPQASDVRRPGAPIVREERQPGPVQSS